MTKLKTCSCYIFICEQTSHVPYIQISMDVQPRLISDWLLCKNSCVTHFCECSVGVVLNSAVRLSPKSLSECIMWWSIHHQRVLMSILICKHIWLLWEPLQHLSNALQMAALWNETHSQIRHIFMHEFRMCAWNRTYFCYTNRKTNQSSIIQSLVLLSYSDFNHHQHTMSIEDRSKMQWVDQSHIKIIQNFSNSVATSETLLNLLWLLVTHTSIQCLEYKH